MVWNGLGERKFHTSGDTDGTWEGATTLRAFKEVDISFIPRKVISVISVRLNKFFLSV